MQPLSALSQRVPIVGYIVVSSFIFLSWKLKKGSKFPVFFLARLGKVMNGYCFVGLTEIKAYLKFKIRRKCKVEVVKSQSHSSVHFQMRRYKILKFIYLLWNSRSCNNFLFSFCTNHIACFVSLRDKVFRPVWPWIFYCFPETHVVRRCLAQPSHSTIMRQWSYLWTSCCSFRKKKQRNTKNVFRLE